MSTNTYTKYVLTGGGTGALDAIDGDDLADNYRAIVITDTGSYTYILDATSGKTEDSPSVIAPDTNPGNKRWILQNRWNKNKVYLSSYVGWAEAIADISTDETTLVADIAYPILVNTVSPSTLFLDWRNNAVISGAFTFTINGPLAAGDYKLFDSTVTVAGLTDPNAIWFAEGDGSTDDTADFTKLVALGSPITSPDKDYVITSMALSSGKAFGNFNGKFIGDLITVDDITYCVIDGIDVDGDIAGVYSILVKGDSKFVAIKNNNVSTNGWAIICKPGSTVSTKRTDNIMITNNIVRGDTSISKTGILIDANTRYGIAALNMVDDFQRSGAGTGSGMALSGVSGGDAETAYDCNGVYYALNVITNIAGEGLHMEDENSATGAIYNVINDVEIGLYLLTTDNSKNHNYIGNLITNYTLFGIQFVGGIGNKYSRMNIINNILDGMDAVQTGAAISLAGATSGEANVLGNIIANSDDDGISILSSDSITIAYNILDTIGGDAIVGTTPNAGDGILIESNNKFHNITGDIIDVANSDNLKGDKQAVSIVLDGAVAAIDVLFVAQRPGVITGIKLIRTTAAAGTTTGTFYVGFDAGLDIMYHAIAITGSAYEVIPYLPKNMTTPFFSADDVITVKSIGDGDASMSFKIQVEYFYYN